MPVRDLLLPELDLEASFTRKHLERVPMDTLGFKPHSKSMTLGELAIGEAGDVEMGQDREQFHVRVVCSRCQQMHLNAWRI